MTSFPVGANLSACDMFQDVLTWSISFVAYIMAFMWSDSSNLGSKSTLQFAGQNDDNIRFILLLPRSLGWKHCIVIIIYG